MKFWNNGKKCIRSDKSPGSGWSRGRIKYTRKSPTKKTRDKISKSNKNSIPWNKGKRLALSEETIEKMSASAKIRSKWCLPDNTGKIPWNKGKSSENSGIIKDVSNHHKGQKRIGNYAKGEDHYRWKGKETEDYKKFAYNVRRLSEHNYIKYKDIINPENHPRGRSGINGAYQLDHIISIYKGYKMNMTVEQLADVSNLQMLSWQDNRSKSNK